MFWRTPFKVEVNERRTAAQSRVNKSTNTETLKRRTTVEPGPGGRGVSIDIDERIKFKILRSITVPMTSGEGSKNRGNTGQFGFIFRHMYPASTIGLVH